MSPLLPAALRPLLLTQPDRLCCVLACSNCACCACVRFRTLADLTRTPLAASGVAFALLLLLLVLAADSALVAGREALLSGC
jgi:hypothetical protein